MVFAPGESRVRAHTVERKCHSVGLADQFFLNSTSNNKFKSEKAFDRGVIRRGHSTPQMAGKFAKRIGILNFVESVCARTYSKHMRLLLVFGGVEGAKKLVLSHFSARYDNSDESTTDNIMGEIEQMAARASGLTGRSSGRWVARVVGIGPIRV